MDIGLSVSHFLLPFHEFSQKPINSYAIEFPCVIFVILWFKLLAVQKIYGLPV